MGYGAQLEVVADAEDINTRAALNGLAQAVGSGVSSQGVAANASVGLPVEQGLATSGDMANIEQAVLQLFSGQGGGPATEQSFIAFITEKMGAMEAENPSNWVIPGYLVMFVFFGAALSAEAIVRERQNRTLERLLATSVRWESILGAYLPARRPRV